jgi:hypothetical protein
VGNDTVPIKKCEDCALFNSNSEFCTYYEKIVASERLKPHWCKVQSITVHTTE